MANEFHHAKRLLAKGNLNTMTMMIINVTGNYNFGLRDCLRLEPSTHHHN